MGGISNQSPAILKKTTGAANVGSGDGQTVQQRIASLDTAVGAAQTAITDEATARANADTALNNSIANEAVARTAAIDAINVAKFDAANVIDEDNFASDSPTKVPTQQSVKAYVASLPAGPTLGTPVATTSGTSIDFTGIPAGTKRITVMFSNVSSNGTSNFLIQIGDSGGIEVTGYNSVAGVGSAAAGGASTTGFYTTHQNSAAYLYSGTVVLTLENSSTFTWTAFGGVGVANTGAATVSQGSKSLSAMLDRVRLTTASGADTFDAGEINISFE